MEWNISPHSTPSCTPHGGVGWYGVLIWHSTPACTPHSTRWSATPIHHSKMTPECGVQNSAECHSKYPENGHHKWMTSRGVWPFCIQIGPFRVHKTHIPQVNLYFFKSQMQYFLFLACSVADAAGIQRNGPPTPEMDVSKGHSEPTKLFSVHRFPL